MSLFFHIMKCCHFVIFPSVLCNAHQSLNLLQGIHRQFSAFHVLQSVQSFFCRSGASCKLDISTFTADVSIFMFLNSFESLLQHIYIYMIFHVVVTDQCFK